MSRAGRLVGALLLLLAAACTPPPSQLPRGMAPPDGWVTMPDGARLALHAWLPPGKPEAVILALHGFGDSGEFAFGDAAAAWARQGIAVYAPDQRGFGVNASRQDWPGTQRLASDAVALAGALRQRHPGLPLTVVGHSMGGGISLLASAQGIEADRLVLAAPAITGGPAIGSVARNVAALAAWAMPEHRWTGRGLIEIRPTDNLPIWYRAATDPRSFDDASSRELRGLVEVMDLAAAAAPLNPLPTLTLVGARDMLIDPEDVREVARALPCSAGVVLYPEGWHWLFHDLQAPRVWADVAAFATASSVPTLRPAPGSPTVRCRGR